MLPAAPSFPLEIDYVYEWFLTLIIGVASNGMGPTQVTWRDVQAWREQMGLILEPWEAHALVRLGFHRAVIESEKLDEKLKSRKT